MNLLFLNSLFFLIAFMIIATYDGAYLHLWKYELFNNKESYFEHKTHTIRAILFPLILWLLFIDTSYTGFIFGIALVVIDIIFLALDAFSENESRQFMGGLPKWEYILHIFSNSFHFSAILLIILTRLKLENNVIYYSSDFLNFAGLETIQFIAINILPGAIILAIIHLLLIHRIGQKYWNLYRAKVTCC